VFDGSFLAKMMYFEKITEKKEKIPNNMKVILLGKIDPFTNSD